MKKWRPGLKLTQESPNSIPIWVCLPNLDLDFWSIEAISRIASILGNPLRLDSVTEGFIRISYARVLVEVNYEFDFLKVSQYML